MSLPKEGLLVQPSLLPSSRSSGQGMCRSDESSWSHRIFPEASRRWQQAKPTNSFFAVAGLHAPLRSLSEQNPTELLPPVGKLCGCQGRRDRDDAKGRHMMWPHASCQQRRTFSPQNSTLCPSCLCSAPRRRQAVLLNTRRSLRFTNPLVVFVHLYQLPRVSSRQTVERSAMQKLTLVVLGEVAADDLVDSGPLRGGGVRTAHLAALRPGGGPAGGAGYSGVDGHG